MGEDMGIDQDLLEADRLVATTWQSTKIAQWWAESKPLLASLAAEVRELRSRCAAQEAGWLKAACDRALAIDLDDLGGDNYGEGTCSTWEDIREEHEASGEDEREISQYTMICEGAERVRGAVIAALWGTIAPATCEKCEAWARAVAEMGKDELPCGHKVVDLIGGTEKPPGGGERPAVTKCGACLLLRQGEHASRKKREAAHTATFLRYEDALQRIASGGQPYDPEGIARAALFEEPT